MSYENEKEVVLTWDTFIDWCGTVNGNQAAMKRDWNEKKPLFHLNEATGEKVELEKYEFVYHPMKLDVTADEIIAAKGQIFGDQPNKTATARYFAKDGHMILEHHRLNK